MDRNIPSKVSFMEEEFGYFFDAKEIYLKDKTFHNKNNLEREIYYVFFQLKAQFSCGYISPVAFEEAVDFLESEMQLYD